MAKRILIIDDESATVENIVAALKGLGEITIFTSDESGKVMPPREKAVEMIHGADVVLLDHDLGYATFSGQSLLQDCEGRKVVGISVICLLGEINFPFKHLITEPKFAQELRKLVTGAIAG